MGHTMDRRRIAWLPGHTALDGRQERSRALLWLFVGVPAAWVFSGIWSMLVEGPGLVNADPRFTGWTAVLLDVIPAAVVMVGAALVSLGYAARALRSGTARSRGVLWLSDLGLALVLAYNATVLTDTASAPSDATLNWFARAAAVLVAIGAGVAAEAWARRR